MVYAHDIDLSVEICGLHFNNPFILASGPPTGDGEKIRRAFREGWAGAVTKTLTLDPEGCKNVTPFICGIRDEHGLVGLANFDAGSTQPLSKWITDIKELKSEFPDRIIIGSLMHTQQMRREDWIEAARGCLDGGVDALELNFSCPHLLAEWGAGSSIGENPEAASMVTRWVRGVARVPIIVKLPAFIPDLKSVCVAVKTSGADAIATTNTINSLNIDIDKKLILPSVDGKSGFSGYSGIGIKPMGLRNVAKMAGMADLPILGIGGISSWRDAVEYLMVGASAVQLCTAVMLKGSRIISELIDGLTNYMARESFSKIGDMVGLLLPQITEYSSLRREARVVSSINEGRCIKDGLCFVVCTDSSGGAIQLDGNRTPHVDKEKCTGCSLCQQVCPVPDCIEMKPVS